MSQNHAASSSEVIKYQHSLQKALTLMRESSRGYLRPLWSNSEFQALVCVPLIHNIQQEHGGLDTFCNKSQKNDRFLQEILQTTCMYSWDLGVGFLEALRGERQLCCAHRLLTECRFKLIWEIHKSSGVYRCYGSGRPKCLCQFCKQSLGTAESHARLFLLKACISICSQVH